MCSAKRHEKVGREHLYTASSFCVWDHTYNGRVSPFLESITLSRPMTYQPWDELSFSELRKTFAESMMTRVLLEVQQMTFRTKNVALSKLKRTFGALFFWIKQFLTSSLGNQTTTSWTKRCHTPLCCHLCDLRIQRLAIVLRILSTGLPLINQLETQNVRLFLSVLSTDVQQNLRAIQTIKCDFRRQHFC